MKQIITLVFALVFFTNTYASFTQKIIAQSRYNYVNNAWQGKDSVIWQYNSAEDSIQKYSLLYTAGVWTPLQNNIFQYGSNGLVSTYIRQTWDGSNWVNASQYLSTYDANNNEISYEKQVWNSSSSTWAPTLKYINTYSGTNKILSNELLTYNGSAWLHNSQNLYTYDGLDSLLENITQNFDAATFSYKNMNKKSYIWSNQGLFAYNEFIWNDTTTNWQNLNEINNFRNANGTIATIIGKTGKNLIYSYKTEFAYDAATNKVSSSINYSPDTNQTNPIWTPTQKTDYLYNIDSTLKTQTTSNYILSNWLADTAVNYFYLPNKKLDYLIQSKNNSGTMVDVHKSSYAYDANFNNIHYLLQDISGSSLSNNFQAFYYYNTYPLSIKNNNVDINLMKVYPNPCTNFINIQLQNANSQIAQIYIYNSYGQIVQQIIQPINNNNITISTTSLSTGNYILHINCNNKNYQNIITKQ